MAGFFSNLFNFFGNSNPITDRAIDRRLRDIKDERERLAVQDLKTRAAELTKKLELEEHAKTEEFRREGDPLWRFLNQQETVTDFTSSNVAAFWYDKDRRELWVQYKDGSWYRYEDISESEASSLYMAASKGTWVWDNLRMRGTKLGARKEYHMDVAPTTRERKWEQTHDTAAVHAREVAQQSGAKSLFEKLGKFALDKPITNKGRRSKR